MSQYIHTAGDNGGVHSNSSIINRAYYLLAEGLPNAVGTAAAERIYYRALTTKLTPRSRFVDCRLGAIASAEELFGAGSSQAIAVADAFDAVEIIETIATPPPPPAPAISGPDNTVCLFYHPPSASIYLARRESALGDPAQGVVLDPSPAAVSRPSITGDGSIVAFVDADSDMCLRQTDGQSDPDLGCLGVPGTVYSVAMSPDGSKYAFVFLDDAGQPLNSISVFDLVNDTVDTYVLTAPSLDGGSIEIVSADAMDFSRDGDVLVYDAFNVVNLPDGSQQGLWSIYGFDLAAGTVFPVVSPTPGLDIGNPSFAHTTDRLIAFDAFDPVGGDITVHTLDLFTGNCVGVVTVTDPYLWTTPSYTGDDLAIVVTAPDSTPTGTSLYVQSLALDNQTPTGSPMLWLEDGAFGVVYRRGAFVPTPPPEFVELVLETGAPRIEGLDLNVPVGSEYVPVRLTLSHTVTGAIVAGGESTVDGQAVFVSGKLKYRKATGHWTYSLKLAAPFPKVSVKISGDASTGFATASYKGPLGKTRSAFVAAPVRGFSPTSRITLWPSVDARGRVFGTGTTLGGFGNDFNTIGLLSGKVTPAGLKLSVKDASAKRRFTFKGVRIGSEFVGRLTYKLPPASGRVDNYVIPDIFR